MLLKETPASREADLKDALHTFFSNLKENKPKPALHGARRLDAKGYKVRFWTTEEWAAAAETKSPGELFCKPDEVDKKRTPAEEIVYSCIRKLKFPQKSTVEYHRCYYKDGLLAYAIQIGKTRAKLWRILHYLQEHPVEKEN
jgi:hypothetical protein